MYTGGIYYAPYRYGYMERKRKKARTRKRFLAVMTTTACITLFSASLIHKTPAINVSAAPEKPTVETQDTTPWGGLAPDSISNDTSSPDSAPLNMTDTETEENGNETPVVFIDAGHGGEDEGCSSDGIQEKTINLAIAGLVQERLEDSGYTVIMSREDDTYITKEDRVIQANAAQAAIYVSIHQNASEDAGVSGLEVWYDGTDMGRDNKRLANLIQQQTIKSTGASERELRGDADFHVTGSTTMPACLIETGFLTNTGERNKLVTTEYQEQLAEGIVQGIEYYFHPKTMYLTFDDGPTEENTARVLDILKDRGIKATFFVVGDNVEKHPEMLQRIAAEGHTIGIHCNTHDYNMLYASVDSYIEDFEKAHQLVYDLTGVDTKLFRFPGGSINAYNKDIYEEIIEEMTNRGYIYFDWNASVEDAVGHAEPEELIANGVNTTLGRKKIVMLAHDVVYNTGLCLPELLDRLPEYEMKPLNEDVEPIQF